jgi:hypothetical protein
MYLVLMFTVLFNYALAESSVPECALLREEFEALKVKTQMW